MDKQTELPSVNQLTEPLVDHLAKQAGPLRLAVSKQNNGCRIIDAGIKASGGLEAGRLIAEICMGGLGRVSLRAGDFHNCLWHLDVHSSNPVLSCLGSQYAGWHLHTAKGKQAFNALGSGPARAMGSGETLYEVLDYRDKAGPACIVIEVDKYPPVEMTDKIAEKCGISASELTVILTPISSLAGSVQVVARVLETALHKAHALHFPLDKIIDGAGTAPICPPSTDFLTMMGRSNDAILFAGQIQLFVDADDDEAKALADKLPSSASADYGRPFAQTFKAVNYDFYKIDPMLFSPARVAVTSLSTGYTFYAGKVEPDLLKQSFS